MSIQPSRFNHLESYVSHPQMQQRLTSNGIAMLRTLNEQDEKKMEELRATRLGYEAEVKSIDEVIREIDDTIRRRQAKMRGDYIAVMQVDQNPTRLNAFTEVEPAVGSCESCGNPVWQVPPSQSAPTGLIHSFGATCNPEDPDSGVATLTLGELGRRS